MYNLVGIYFFLKKVGWNIPWKFRDSTQTDHMLIFTRKKMYNSLEVPMLPQLDSNIAHVNNPVFLNVLHQTVFSYKILLTWKVTFCLILYKNVCWLKATFANNLKPYYWVIWSQFYDWIYRKNLPECKLFFRALCNFSELGLDVCRCTTCLTFDSRSLR